MSNLFYNKLKINSFKEKSKENNKNYSSYLNTEKIQLNKKNINLPSAHKNLSLSPFNKSNYNKTTDNNKIINININNILKIKKQYSLNMEKSDDSSNNIIYKNNNSETLNNKKLLKIKNYFSSIPLSFDKKEIKKHKNVIKHYSRNQRTHIKNDMNNPLISPELKSNKNYSSLLKKQFLEERLYKKNI